MAERGGFEPPVPLLGVHTISSRAPSTARSPLRFAISSTYARHPAVQLPKCLQRDFLGERLATYQNGRSGAKMNCRGHAKIGYVVPLMSFNLFSEEIRPTRGFSVLIQYRDYVCLLVTN